MATLVPGEKARMYALGGIARGGATRGGYVDGRVYITMDGWHVGFGSDDAAIGVTIPSLTITDALDETPNTASFRVNGVVPAFGAEVIITLGSKNSLTRLFAGYSLGQTQRYAADNPRHIQADVNAVDYTWLFGFYKATGRYANQSATNIAIDLINRYAAVNGFTTKGIAPYLPTLDEFTLTNEDLDAAMTRLARRIGGYWYVDYLKNVHLFVTMTDPSPVDLTPTHPSLAHFTRTVDRTQVLTRVYCEGRGTKILGHVPAGDTTIPVEAVDMFEIAPDVFVKHSPQGSTGGAQHLDYAGVVVGQGGAIVGPGVTPTGAPLATLQPGGAVDIGPHSYAFTWTTAAGETLPGAVTSITVAGPRQIANPTSSGFVSWFPITDSRLTPGASYVYAITYFPKSAADGGGTGETMMGPPTAPFIPAAGHAANFALAITHPANNVDPAIYGWNLYRSVNGGAFHRVTGQPSGTSQYLDWSQSDADIAGQPTPPATNTTSIVAKQRVALEGISIGPTVGGVTARKLYRTATNGTQLKYLATITDNTTTTYTDAAADATLGANAPVNDTSGLTQPVGQVNPGSSTVILSGAAGIFLPAGGWAVIGNGEQVIRYTGVSGNTLTGIPPTGPGALTAVVAYGASITAAPMLTGIPATGTRSIVHALTAGDELYLVVVRDDADRQTQLADAVNVGPGIREEWVQDRRLSITEARARANATLALRPLDRFEIGYTCRDLRTAAGKNITVNLPPPTNVSGTFRIQQVTIHNFRPYPTQYPTFTVTASSSRFSFEDLLRRTVVQA